MAKKDDAVKKWLEENKPEEGGNLPSNLVVTIERSKDGYRDDYNQGNTLLLLWNVKVHESDVDIEDMDDYRVQYSWGAGWDTDDGGKTATHDTKKAPTKTSGVGRLISRCAYPDEDADCIEIAHILAERGSIREAKIWEGLKFRLERKDFPGSDPKFKQSILLPTEFMGEVGEGDEDEDEKPARKAKAAPEKKKQKKGEFDADDFLDQLPAKVKKELRTLAKDNDQSDWLDEALRIEAVTEDDALEAVIVDNAAEIFEALS